LLRYEFDVQFEVTPPPRPGSPTRRGVGALSRPRHRPHRSRRPTLRRAPRLRSRSWMARRRRRAARRAAAVVHPPNTAASHGADVPWRENLPGGSLQGGARAGRTAAWPRPGWRVSTPCGRRSGAATSRSSAWRMRWRWGCAAGQPRACRRGDQPRWGYIDGRVIELASQLGPWLASEVPNLVSTGMVVHASGAPSTPLMRSRLPPPRSASHNAVARVASAETKS
jgi:hypothetical protein